MPTFLTAPVHDKARVTEHTPILIYVRLKAQNNSSVTIKNPMPPTLPTLYSFRRCPYAIRARLALTYASIAVDVQEVSLKQKPEQLLALSPKGTVPVLHLPNGVVLEESLDIMQWALTQNDPDNWLDFDSALLSLIEWNDGHFKYYLDRYKYADRYPEFSAVYYRQHAEVFLAELNDRLTHHAYLNSSRSCLLDMAIFPFIRQFAAVDNAWFIASKYSHVNHWLSQLVASELFVSVMAKNHENKS